MYLLYLDESGSHQGSSALVVAGLAVHEQDAFHLQQKLDGMLRSRLPQGTNPLDFELHAAEIKSPVKSVRSKKVTSKWAGIPLPKRLGIMSATFGAIRDFDPKDPARPCMLFGAVVDRVYGDREERAYEEVLHKFDEMLTRQAAQSGTHERGIVIHDRRVIEKDVQGWAGMWRHVAGRIGKLTHLADVPLFADSRASRLIQAADFVAWGLNRYYSETRDEKWIRPLWNNFDSADGRMHGLIHVSPRYHECDCPPCKSRHA